MKVGGIDTSGVVGAVRLAAARTGVDFTYLLAQARLESGLDPAAAAPTSSARGLYQFTRGTWLDTVRKHGAEHGLGWAAAALKAGADPATRAAILNLRSDAAASASMAAAYAGDNSATLERHLGRAPNGTDLYLAHFLGPAGAVRFLRARDAAPDALAASAVTPAAALANRRVFAARDGRARTLDEVYDRFTAKLASGSAVPDGGKVVPPRAAWPPRATIQTVAAPQAARVAYLMLAQLGA